LKLRPNSSLERVFALDDLAPLVVAARRARTMRKLHFAALGTGRGRRTRQEVVRSATITTGLGVPPFWVGHEVESFSGDRDTETSYGDRRSVLKLDVESLV